MNKLELFLKKNSSNILTIAGATGVISTAVLAAKATPKAVWLLEEARDIKGEKLTVLESIETVWLEYMPAALIGFSTIACIFGINYLSVKNQASLISAYALLENSYKEYKNKVNELYGKDADLNVTKEIIKGKSYKDLKLEEGQSLFYDYQSGQTFVSTLEEVAQSTNKFLEAFHDRGYANLNEYYDYLGIEFTEYGYQLGWFDVENNDPYNCSELEFTYEKITMDNGMPCWVITANIPPTFDYII